MTEPRSRRPPGIPRRLLRLFLNGDAWLERSGDMREIYATLHREHGRLPAVLWYWGQAVVLLPRLAAETLTWRLRMIGNYLKTALRNVRRHKGFAFINIVGLAIGLAACLLIFQYVRHECGYDSHHKDLDRIFRLVMHFEHPSVTFDIAKVGPPAAVRLREDFPQVERAARMMRPFRPILMRRGEASFYEQRLYYAEPELFDILTFEVLAGDPAASFTAPRSLALTRTSAVKYFGNEDPIGRTLNLDGEDFEITALLENPPADTHLPFDFLASFKTIENQDMADSWGWTNFYTYVKLAPHVEHEEFGESILKLEQLYLSVEEIEESGKNNRYYLQPVRSIHLQSHLAGETDRPGSVRTLSVVGAIGLLILLIACINFTNLSTARFAHRTREAGLRKVVGAHSRQVAAQFLSESLLTVLLAFAAALLLARLTLPVFNDMTEMAFTFGEILTGGAIPAFAALWLLTGLAAGVYPALFLAGARPAAVLKGGGVNRRGRSHLRRALVLVQFAASITLLIGALTVRRQLNFVLTTDLGLNREQKLVLPMHGDFTDGVRHDRIKREFLAMPGIRGATASMGVPGNNMNAWGTGLIKGWTEGDEPEVDEDLIRRMFYFPADLDFVSRYGIQLLAGRDFRREDFDRCAIINQRAVAVLGLESPDLALDRSLLNGFNDSPIRIVGVARDFHFQGLQNEIEPVVIFCGTGGHEANQFNMLTLEVDTGVLPVVLSGLETKWKALFPGRPYSYRFVDEIFERWYRAERRTGRMFEVFVLLGLFIAALGLFGLASYTAERRTKEIGVRKVLGAPVARLVALLGWEFTRWALAANLVAWPVAYLLMRSWLNAFAYRTSMGPGVFFAAALLTLAVALAAVAWQSVRAARADPIHALRYE